MIRGLYCCWSTKEKLLKVKCVFRDGKLSVGCRSRDYSYIKVKV
jgi:hypothetical protein